MSEKRYIQVILPLRLEWEPCYCLGGADNSAKVQVGDRVRVVFAHKTYVGVVSAVNARPDIAPQRIAPVSELLPSLPAVSSRELEFWRFLSDYYLCTIGEVFKAAYPAQKIQSEEIGARSAERRKRLEDAEEALWKTRVERLMARLAAKDAALSKKHNAEVSARLNSERARIVSELQKAQLHLEAISSGELFTKDSLPLIKTVRSEIWPELKEGRPLLFKTSDRIEEYVAACSNCLAEGNSVLLMVPETALAKELETGLRERFEGALLVYHSKETTARRRVISDRIRSGRPYILLGTRSSIFLPFKSLGLIIVDEEQSPFYKSDIAPRLNARDAAVKLAGIHCCPVLLGSEAPSLESEYNVACGKYAILERPVATKALSLIDIAAEKRKRGMVGCISRALAGECREGRIALIRGFETQEEVAESLSQLFPDDTERFDIIPLAEASRKDLSDYATVAVLNADAIFRPDDFRSDERACQFISGLNSRCRRLFLQTRTPDHQVFALKGTGSLLTERRTFSLPPYTRLVDINLLHGKTEADASSLSRKLRRSGFIVSDAMRRRDGQLFLRITLPRDRSLSDKKQALSRMAEGIGIPDVDPA